MIIYHQDIGAGKGKYYAVNFPLRDGIDDESFQVSNDFLELLIVSSFNFEKK